MDFKERKKGKRPAVPDSKQIKQADTVSTEAKKRTPDLCVHARRQGKILFYCAFGIAVVFYAAVSGANSGIHHTPTVAAHSSWPPMGDYGRFTCTYHVQLSSLTACRSWSGWNLFRTRCSSEHSSALVKHIIVQLRHCAVQRRGAPAHCLLYHAVDLM